jgi:hypothetical protein
MEVTVYLAGDRVDMVVEHKMNEGTVCNLTFEDRGGETLGMALNRKGFARLWQIMGTVLETMNREQ